MVVSEHYSLGACCLTVRSYVQGHIITRMHNSNHIDILFSIYTTMTDRSRSSHKMTSRTWSQPQMAIRLVQIPDIGWVIEHNQLAFMTTKVTKHWQSRRENKVQYNRTNNNRIFLLPKHRGASVYLFWGFFAPTDILFIGTCMKFYLQLCCPKV